MRYPICFHLAVQTSLCLPFCRGNWFTCAAISVRHRNIPLNWCCGSDRLCTANNPPLRLSGDIDTASRSVPSRKLRSQAYLNDWKTAWSLAMARGAGAGLGEVAERRGAGGSQGYSRCAFCVGGRGWARLLPRHRQLFPLPSRRRIWRLFSRLIGSRGPRPQGRRGGEVAGAWDQWVLVRPAACSRLRMDGGGGAPGGTGLLPALGARSGAGSGEPDQGADAVLVGGNLVWPSVSARQAHPGEERGAARPPRAQDVRWSRAPLSWG